MPEPKVIVLLVSPLEDVFAEKGKVSPDVLKSYNMLTAKGMNILLTTSLPLEEAAEIIEPLSPPAPLLNFGEGFHIPENSDFQLPEMTDFSLTAIIGKLRETGDIIIPIGIGRLPEHDFLNDVELAALLPGSEKPKKSVTVYQCKTDGPAAWCEWAETMMRRIRIILNKSEMRQWNGE